MSGGTVGEDEAQAPGEAASLDARHASRQLAAKVERHEREALYAEHSKLTESMFVEGLDEASKRRLRYVRYRLDLLEDAELGDRLDEVQVVVEDYEKLAAQIANFVADANTVRIQKRRRRR